MSNNERRRNREQALADLKKEVMQAEGTMVEVVMEACLHLEDNYDVKKNPHFSHDFVVVVGAGFFGHHKRTGLPAATTEFFAQGDLHLFSHVLAEYMHKEPKFASAIFHALEVYSRQSCRHDDEEG